MARQKVAPSHAATRRVQKSEARRTSVSQTMKAAVLVEFGKTEVQEVPIPQISEDEVLIKVDACGICRSDWHLWRGDPSLVMYMEWSGGKLPIIMGHEVVGTVAAAGKAIKRVKEGDKVVFPASSSGDGRECVFCMSGRSNICAHLCIPGFGIDGGYAQYMRVPAGSVADLVQVPDSLKDKDTWTAIAGCGMGTAFNAVVDKLQIQPGEKIVITGTGGVGLSSVAIASQMGAEVIAVDLNPQSLRKAKRLGASATIEAEADDSRLTEKITETARGLVDAALDTTGNPNVGVRTLLAVRPGGRMALSGLMVKGAETMPLPADAVVAREIALKGTLMLPAQRYVTLFGMLSRGDINLDPVIHKEIGVDEVQGAFNAMSEFKNAGRFVVTRYH